MRSQTAGIHCKEGQTGGRGGEGEVGVKESLARFTITDIKLSFSRITKISK